MADGAFRQVIRRLIPRRLRWLARAAFKRTMGLYYRDITDQLRDITDHLRDDSDHLRDNTDRIQDIKNQLDATFPVIEQTLREVGALAQRSHRLQETQDALRSDLSGRLAQLESKLHLQPVDGRRPFGVNLAGYLISEKGIGEAARSTIRVLEATGIPYVLNNLIDSGSVNNDTTYAGFSDENPYGFNVTHVNASEVPDFAWYKGEAYFRGRYNIGVWNWELSSFPEEWLARFQYHHEIWVPSNFVVDALSRVSPVPVLRMPYAIRPEANRRDDLDRPHFGLPPDAILFLSMFDSHSELERKNPLGLVEAFERAFPKEKDVFLLIKSSRSDPQATDAMQQATKQTNVRIMDAVLSRDEVHALYRLCDCYISLHRSEGFGLTLVEAMSAGKPVIATGYGGNIDFMAPDDSYLVRYKLMEIDRDHGPYRKGWAWADPDLDHAAELMRRVYENREEAREIGRKAREDIHCLLHPRVVGDLVRQRLQRIASLQGMTIPDLEPRAD